jgi:hypothetical protein
MSQLTLSETGLIGIITLGIGFVISFCRQAEQSRCKQISVCWGLVKCERQPLSGETILELNNTDEAKEPV